MPCIRICKIGQNSLETLRKVWEKNDLRVIVLCSLFTQLYLLVYGRLRRKSITGIMITVSVLFLYWLADLLATIGLGKLSKVQGDDDDLNSVNQLRGLWATIILFYLGGPDSMTILRLEENEMWLKHFIGLLAQGVRTSFVLFATWPEEYMLISLLAWLMLIPGLINYGVRVWVIKSRAEKEHEGFVRLKQSTIDKINVALARRPNVKLVLQAYSHFQTSKPHIPDYECDDELVNKFHEWVVQRGSIHTTFKLIEIELGLIYDMLFSKVGMIFNVFGSILRFISFSCIVSVLVGLLLFKKPPGLLKGDIPITIILLVGALFLEIAGVLEQLGSDWAIVWASKHYPSKLVMPVFHLHEFMISRRKRWSELMGQFSLLHFFSQTKPKIFCEIVESLGRKDILWKKFSLPLSPVQPSLKELIIKQLREKPRNISDGETSEASTMKIGEWTLQSYGCLDAFKWIVELEFDESIVIWHIATDVCYHSELEDHKLITDEVEVTKTLSYYMMHLLLTCPSLCICDNNKKPPQAYTNVENFFEENGLASSNENPYKLLLKKEQLKKKHNSTTNNIQKLVCELMEKENRWKIMSNVWVEMLCYAASRCAVKYHLQELRSGGQFITHVWLLLIHLGVTKKLEEFTSQKSIDKNALDSIAKRDFGRTFGEIINE